MEKGLAILQREPVEGDSLCLLVTFFLVLSEIYRDVLAY